jgi:hypothetical protein
MAQDKTRQDKGIGRQDNTSQEKTSSDNDKPRQWRMLHKTKARQNNHKSKARQHHRKTRQGKITSRQGKAKQDKTRQDKTRQDKTRRDKTSPYPYIIQLLS